MLAQITETVNQLTDMIGALTLFVPAVVGFFSVLSAVTPKPVESSPAAKLHKVINFLAFNFGHAENKR